MRHDVQQLSFGILHEEFSVGPKPLGYGYNAEYGPDSVRFVSTPNLYASNEVRFRIRLRFGFRWKLHAGGTGVQFLSLLNELLLGCIGEAAHRRQLTGLSLVHAR